MRTIIVYSTKYGSVEKAALKLKKQISGAVVVANVKTEPSLNIFDNIILAGSVYAGSIQKGMKKFVQTHHEELKTKRLGLFICAGEQKEKNIESYLIKAFTEDLYKRAVAKDNLGYEYDLKRFSFFDKLIVRIVGVKKSESKFYGDKISRFAQHINSKG